MAVSKRLRFEILRRDGFACRYCGATGSDSELHVDHVVPEALGGADEPTNLVTACADCNRGKAAISPDQGLVENVADDAMRWASAMEEAAAVLAVKREKIDVYADQLEQAWGEWRTDDGDGDTFPLPYGWRDSAEQFYTAGLNLEDVVRLIEVTMTKPRLAEKWRYFCGCCWRSIRERQEIARDLIERDIAGGG